MAIAGTMPFLDAYLRLAMEYVTLRVFAASRPVRLFLVLDGGGYFSLSWQQQLRQRLCGTQQVAYCSCSPLQLPPLHSAHVYANSCLCIMQYLSRYCFSFKSSRSTADNETVLFVDNFPCYVLSFLYISLINPPHPYSTKPDCVLAGIHSKNRLHTSTCSCIHALVALPMTWPHIPLTLLPSFLPAPSTYTEGCGLCKWRLTWCRCVGENKHEYIPWECGCGYAIAWWGGETMCLPTTDFQSMDADTAVPFFRAALLT